MKNVQVARLLAYVTGMVNQQLLLQNEYLIAENGFYDPILPGRVPLTNSQRTTLAEIAKRFGPPSAGTGCLGGKTGNDPGVVPQTHCAEIQWSQTSQLPGTASGLP